MNANPTTPAIPLMKYYSDPAEFLRRVKGVQNICYSEKKDGYRCVVDVDLEFETVQYLSSNGKTFPNFSRFDADFLTLARELGSSVTFDCEVTGKDGGKSDEVTTQIRRKKNVDDSIFRFWIFDLIVGDYPFVERYNYLCSAVDGLALTDIEVLEHKMLPEDFSSNTVAKLGTLAKQAFDSGMEGWVLKNVHGLYECKRSWNCCKLVQEKTADLKVLEVLEGTGKLAGMVGKFVCELSSGRTVKVAAGCATMDQLKKFMLTPPALIEVAYKEWTSKGSLRHPRFKSERFDKNEVSVH